MLQEQVHADDLHDSCLPTYLWYAINIWEFDNDLFLAELALVILSFVKYPIIDDFVGERFDLYTVRHNTITLPLHNYLERFNG